jgi:hypothetical protein
VAGANIKIKQWEQFKRMYTDRLHSSKQAKGVGVKWKNAIINQRMKRG